MIREPETSEQRGSEMIYRCHDFQKFHCGFAITIDPGGASEGRRAEGATKQLCQIVSRLDFVQLAELDETQDTILNEDTTERNFFRFDFVSNFGVQDIDSQANDTELDNVLVGLPIKKDASTVGAFIAFDIQHLNVDGRLMKGLNPDRHVFVVIQEAVVGGRDTLAWGLGETT